MGRGSAYGWLRKRYQRGGCLGMGGRAWLACGRSGCGLPLWIKSGAGHRALAALGEGELFTGVVDGPSDVGVAVVLAVDDAHGVEDGGVVAPECLADRGARG